MQPRPRERSAFDLVVISHLRWDGVWQRPQHLVTRMARHARHTWYVEEPVPDPGRARELRTERRGDVTRLALHIPTTEPIPGLSHPQAVDYPDLVAEECGELLRPVVWLYTPLGLPLAQRLQPQVLVYDVMDDLAAFRFAPPEMALRHAQTLAAADLVFTGGRSLHQRVLEHRHRPATAYCFPSGVEAEHFQHPHVPHERPVAGYVGVIDERLDLDLLAELADTLPGWTLRLVGPVLKLDERDLPRRPNIEYAGHCAYAELPRVLAGFDVALMPFALNEATRSISPTKTLEYLAAGLPVVSTRVPDVVRDHAGVVQFADDARGFAAVCIAIEDGRVTAPADRVAETLATRHWDVIAAQMLELIDSADAARDAAIASA